MEQPSLKDLEVSKEVSKEFLEMLQNVGKIVDNLMTIETKINNEIPYKFWSDWKLHLSMFRVISEWAKGELKWNQLSHLYETFEGNFCRNVLRLVNLIRNVESIALLTNNVNLINKLDGYQEKLIRDIVIIDSLYL
jgi:superfamily II RNA helicase